MNADPHYRLPPGVEIRHWGEGPAAEEWVVYHEGTGQTLRLSAAACVLLATLIRGPLDRGRLAEALAGAFADPPGLAELESALDGLIEGLVKHELIELRDAPGTQAQTQHPQPSGEEVPEGGVATPAPQATINPPNTATTVRPRLGELSLHEVRARLRTGLALATGPFVFRIVSHLPLVATNLHRLYADFPLAEGPFADFHVRVDAVRGPRRWFMPQVQFWLDGFTPFKPLPLDQAYAMLEWGMNWCIASHAHHYLMLHAAVLERGGRALILPGDPGAGKSTLTAALMLDGWRLLSDEIALIDRDDGYLYGLARPVSLKNASIEVIRTHASLAVFGDVARDTHKGTVSHLKPTPASVARIGEPARPAWIVFPRWKQNAPARLTPHPKAAAFLHLASHAFNYGLLGGLGFTLTARLMDTASCWDFEYGHLPEALAVFRELAEA